MALKFYNTLSKKIEEFEPLNKDEVGFYSCGPTVYNYAHIGNLRAYIFADILQKTIEYNGYKVKRIMNITDIGHLTSDADDGDDKMVKALKREGKPFTLDAMKDIAIFYKEKFMEDLEKLNIKKPDLTPFASEHIEEYVKMIEKLEKDGYAYRTSDGIYFETSKFPDYFDFSGNHEIETESESRIGKNNEKKSQADFALWKFSDSNGIGYDTTLGKGFPGWHIECSGMSIKYLGEQFDIHTGGIDHISVHHPNEIAQSESYTDKKPFVKYWLHNEHVNISGAKMAKSGDNFLTLKILEDKNIDPVAYRFWLLMANYRTQVNFNWDALEGAQIALKRLYNIYRGFGDGNGSLNENYKQKFLEFINDDMDTPKAITLLWDLVKDENINNEDRKATILDFDRVLSLGFEKIKEEIIPEEIIKLAEARKEAKSNKNFTKSDELREEIKSLGYEIKDTGDNYEITKI